MPTITTKTLAWVLPVLAIVSVTGCGLEIPGAKPESMDRFDLSNIPLIPFPQRPAPTLVTQNVVEYHVTLPVPADQPGHASDVRVLLPSNRLSNDESHEKLPTLIFNGSGAYLFSGMSLTDDDMQPMQRYAEAGYAVIGYATDGCQPDFNHEPTKPEIESMVRAYVASKAGLINAKRALDFALATFPEIDSEKIYSIGHSSGGKQALLFAQHDDRIQGCVAFAPACRMDLGSSVAISRISGTDTGFLSEEVNRSMPIFHAKHNTKPTVLVYSPSDRITRKSEIMAMADAVNDNLELVEVDCDSHGGVADAGYDESLIWLAKQTNPEAGNETIATGQMTEPLTLPSPIASLPTQVPTPTSAVMPKTASTATSIQLNTLSPANPSQTAAEAETKRKKLQQEMLLRAGIQSNPFLTGN